MLASTSRAVLRSATSMAKAPAFSTSAPTAVRRRIVVELLHDVKGVGQKFDHVKVAAGFMSNALLPYRLARYIPYKNSKDAPRVMRASPPVEERSEVDGLIAEPVVEATPVELLNILRDLPTNLVFLRRVVAENEAAIHGSLTISDVGERLAETGLTPQGFEIGWTGSFASQPDARLKELGTYEAIVAVRGFGGERIVVTVECQRQE